MGLPLFTVDELRRIEQAAQVALPTGELMRRAGTAAATSIDAHSGGRPQSVLIACGPGNNGGDGYVCATELARRGHSVTCVALASPMTADAQAAAARWANAGHAVVAAIPPERTFDVIVDAMFGIGLTRPLDGAFLDAAQWMATQRARVAALDVPSGLDADRGTWVGGIEGVRAARTLTFLGAKPGLYTHEGTDAAGNVHVDPLGVNTPASLGALLATQDFLPALAPRRRNSHKGSYGNLAIVGGNVGMVGAALIAARAGLRLGAGRVYVDCVGAPELLLDPLQPELMFRRASELTGLDAIVLGCGLGADAAGRKALRTALARAVPVVIDADALNLLAEAPPLCAELRERRAASVLTPHPLEAARLLGTSAADVQSDRVGAARTLAERLNSIVVLKGAGSIIAEPTQPAARYWISTTGSPALATAGTGDALAGMIGALIVQGSPIAAAVRAAVWLHGAAADEFGDELGFVATDIAPRAAAILSRLRRERAV